MSDDFNFSTGMPSDEMAQYLQVYLDESGEQLDALVESLLVLEQRPADPAQLNEAFRLIHSIKGSSAMMGLGAITILSHQLESHFERLRSGVQQLDQSSMGLILRCIDFLRECNSRLRGGQALASAPELLEELNTLSSAKTPEPRPRSDEHRGEGTQPDSAIDTASNARSEVENSHDVVLVPETPLSAAATATRELIVVIRFERDLALVDVKAELILVRLAELGAIGQTRPARSQLATIAESHLLEIELSTIRPDGDVLAAADVAGVAQIELREPETEIEDDHEPHLPPAALAAEAAEAATPAEAKSKLVETVRVDIERLDNLMNLAGELVVNKARFVQLARQMSPAFKKSSVAGRARAFSDSMRRAIQFMKSQAGNGAATSGEWVEQFHDLESEIDGLEEQARLWEQSRRCFGQITEAIDQMTRVSESLQRGVLDTRMVPIAPLFNRFKRVIRDISIELGKKVNLEIHGEKTELDKRMIDELGDPLVHLVRNAIDHGVEPPELRASRGKPAIGTIRLEAAHSGNNVLVSVGDDGGGINVEKVRERIAERGLLSAADAQALSERDVLEFIWHPGFSTAERVSDISGRGVGMDIVKTRVAELNGAIDLAHVPGQGTTFTIRLPLTLAIIRSLLFRVRHGVFAVPIDNVREIVSVGVDQIVTIHGRQTFDVRGEFIPLVDIDDVFEWHATDYGDAADERLPAEASAKRVSVIILHSVGKSMGLKVDELHGGQDIVIKSLAENFVPIRGLSGASILGDGSVCLLLDVGAVINLAADAARNSAPVARSGSRAPVSQDPADALAPGATVTGR